MRRAKWIVAAVCVAVVGTSVVQAKGPHRLWHKRAKSTKSAKHYDPAYAPIPLGAPMPPGAPTPVDEIPEELVPERLPQAPTIEDASARLNSVRERWNARLGRTADRQTQFQQNRAERLRSLAGRLDWAAPGGNIARIDRAGTAAFEPSTIASATPRSQTPRRRSIFDRSAPQPVEARRPIADRFDLRRQETGPAFPNEAPRF
jgi:hypothetical protein